MASSPAPTPSPRSPACRSGGELGARVGALVAELRRRRQRRDGDATAGECGGDDDGVPTSWREAAGDEPVRSETRQSDSASTSENKTNATTGLAVSLSVWRGAAKEVSKGATKLSLVFSTPPTSEEEASICAELADACDQLYTARLVVEASGSGAPLRDQVDAATRHLLTALEGLASALPSPPKTGAVWEAAETAVETVPKSNRAAYRRAFLNWATELKDIIDEFTPKLLDKTEFDDEVDDLDDDVLCGFGERYEDAEKPAARALLACLSVVGASYKRLLMAIDDAGAHADYNAVARWYSVGQRLAKCATAVGEELYSPIDARDACTHLLALNDVIQDLGGLQDQHRGTNSDNDPTFFPIVPAALWSAKVDAARAELDAIVPVSSSSSSPDDCEDDLGTVVAPERNVREEET